MKSKNISSNHNLLFEYSEDQLAESYEKKVNHYVRNTIQVILSLLNLYNQKFELSKNRAPQFDMLISEIRSLISVYDIHKMDQYVETVDLIDLLQWFQSYFEENTHFRTKRYIITIEPTEPIPVSIQNSQHITLFIHELFVQLYLLMEIHQLQTISLSIDTIQNGEIEIAVKINCANCRITFPVVSNEYPHFDLNMELFQLLLKQLDGSIVFDNDKAADILIFIPTSKFQSIPQESWQ
jgi:hypothetical protein